MKNANDETCTTFQNRISVYIDGELTAPGKTAFLEHSVACQECRQALEDMKQLVGTLGNLPRVYVTDDFNMKLRGRLAAEKTRLEKPSYRFRVWLDEHRAALWSIPAAAAIVVAALMTGTLATWQVNESPVAVHETTPIDHPVSAAHSEEDDLEITRYILESVDVKDAETGVFLTGESSSGTTQLTLTSTSF